MWWGGEDPLGEILRFGNGKEFVVVGVVAGVRNASLNREPAPAIYLAAVLRAWGGMDVVGRRGPAGGDSALRQRKGIRSGRGGGRGAECVAESGARAGDLPGRGAARLGRNGCGGAARTRWGRFCASATERNS